MTEPASEEANIQVVCRFRPYNDREKNLGLDGADKLFKLTPTSVQVCLHQNKKKKEKAAKPPGISFFPFSTIHCASKNRSKTHQALNLPLK
jgi:hypothetical protein